MARPRAKKPGYLLHKASGRAMVVIDGRFIYLGQHGTQASRDQYDRVIGEWIGRGRQTPDLTKVDKETPEVNGVIVAELVDAFWEHAQAYYRPRDPKSPNSEAMNYKVVLRWMNRLFGQTPAVDFGPVKLEAIREQAISPHTVKQWRVEIDPTTGERKRILKDVEHPGWCRNYANRQTQRIIEVFRWGASKEMFTASVVASLRTVRSLSKDHTDARESAKVRPAPQEDVEKVLPHLGATVKAMVELEALTGARPGEIRIVRTGDIDRSNPELWVYRPMYHKTDWHGEEHVREIAIGPRAQEIVKPFLKLNPTAYIFDPSESERLRIEKQRAKRDKPMTPSQKRRADEAAKRKRKRPHGDHYTKNSYTRAIRRA